MKARPHYAWKLLLVFIVSYFDIVAPAQTHAQAQTFPTETHYTVKETPRAGSTPFQDPSSMAMETFSLLAKKAISLLDWISRDNLEIPATPYQRLFHFGRWINDPTDDTCMNTRAKVLVRDSAGQVTFRFPKNCLVEGGYWKDPYAGQDITTPRQIQIDHMVPLKHAYVSGAWKWDFNTRCLYANFMGNDYHLISVSGSENMSKGDRGPDRYMPPEISYRCEYLANWLKIKAIWKLSITSTEAAAIRELVVANNCNEDDFRISQEEMSRTRRFIRNNLNYCTLNKRKVAL